MSVVVVSYNTKALTIRCVETLREDSAEDTCVCIVDNASTDGSVAALEAFAQRHPSGVRVIKSLRNLGFGAANNLGVAQTGGEFIALVNSDAFVEKGTLSGLRSYLQRNPRAAVAGPLLKNPDGSFQESRFAFPTPLGAWVENLGWSRLRRLLKPQGQESAGPVPWLSGACLMIRRAAWEQVGGFDESYFLYAEETDLQRRLAAEGWEIHWTPDFQVTHIGGSSGLAEKEAVRERFFEGADRYILKHHGVAGVWIFRAATVCGALLRWAWSALAQGRHSTSAHQFAWIFRRQISSPIPVDSRRAHRDKDCGAQVARERSESESVD
jgi:GT2 family glycosyltransferase